MDINRKLGIVSAVLLVLSAFTYWNDVRSAGRFQRGQKFVSNLNPNEIAKIEVRSAGGDVTLSRTSDGYQIEEANGYRAKNESVNRLVRTLLDAELAKRVGAGASLAEELGLEPLAEDGVEVAFLGATDQEMVRARVGKESEDGTGRYIAQLDEEGTVGDIFLSEAQVRIDESVSDYLRKEIVDVTSGQIVRIDGPDYVLSKEEGETLSLEGGGEESAAETNKVKSALSRLEFDEVFVADDPAVRGLVFEQGLRVGLDDQSGYIVSIARNEGRTFVQVSGFFAVDRVELSQEDTDEDLQEKSDVLKRSDEINQFNAYHGSWVYALDETEAEPFGLRRKDLLE